MDTQRVVIRESPGAAKLVSGHCVLPLRPDSMLVKVKAAALNPGGGKLLDEEPNTDGCVLGIDYAGVVEKVADGETTKKWKKGDRVAGPAHCSKCPSCSPRI